MAAKSAGGKKGAKAGPTRSAAEALAASRAAIEEGTFTMDFLKVFESQKVPEVKADSEYPDWLFDLSGGAPTFSELKENLDEFDEWPLSDQKRFVKVAQRAVIKGQNEESGA